MVTPMGFMQGPAHQPAREGVAERDARIIQERNLIAQAEASIDAGQGVDWEDVDAWLTELDKDENAPMPEPRAASTPRF